MPEDDDEFQRGVMRELRSFFSDVEEVRRVRRAIGTPDQFLVLLAQMIALVEGKKERSKLMTNAINIIKSTASLIVLLSGAIGAVATFWVWYHGGGK